MALEHAFMKATFLSPRLAEVCNTRLGSPGSARMAAASSLGLGAAGVFKTSAALTVSKASMRLSGGRVTRVEPAEEALRRGTSGGVSGGASLAMNPCLQSRGRASRHVQYEKSRRV